MSELRKRSFWVWEIYPQSEGNSKPEPNALVIHNLLNHRLIEVQSAGESSNEWEHWQSSPDVSWFIRKETVSEMDEIRNITYRDPERAAHYLAQGKGFNEVFLLPIVRLSDWPDSHIDEFKDFFINALNTFKDIKKFGSRMEVLFLPIVIFRNSQLNVLKKLNETIFEQIANDSSNLYLKAMPRVFLFSDRSYSGMKLKEQDIAVNVADFLRFWIMMTASYLSGISEFMSNLLAESDVEYATAEDMWVYATVTAGTIYLPFEHILSWMANNVLKKAVNLALNTARKNKDEMEKGKGSDFHLSISRPFDLTSPNVWSYGKPRNFGVTRGTRTSGVGGKSIGDEEDDAFQLKPSKLGPLQKLDYVEKEWERKLLEEKEKIKRIIAEATKVLGQEFKRKVVEELEKINNEIAEKFDAIKRSEKEKIPLTSLQNEIRKTYEELKQETEKLKIGGSITAKNPGTIPSFSLDKIFNVIRRRMKEDLQNLREKDKRYPSVFGASLFTLILFSLVVAISKYPNIYFLIGAALIPLFYLSWGYLTYFVPVLRNFVEIRQRIEDAVRRNEISFLKKYIEAIRNRFVVKGMISKLNRISRLKERLDELIAKKFRVFLGTVGKAKAIETVLHVPILRDDHYEEFLRARQAFVLDEYVANKYYREFISNSEKYVLDEGEWDWQKLYMELKDEKLSSELENASKLFLKAHDFENLLGGFERDNIYITLKNKISNIAFLNMNNKWASGSYKESWWALFPERSDEFEKIAKDYWGLEDSHIIWGDRGDLAIAAVQLVRISWNISLKMLDKGEVNDE